MLNLKKELFEIGLLIKEGTWSLNLIFYNKLRFFFRKTISESSWKKKFFQEFDFENYLKKEGLLSLDFAIDIPCRSKLYLLKMQLDRQLSFRTAAVFSKTQI